MSKKNQKSGFMQKISQYFKFLCNSGTKEEEGEKDQKRRVSTIKKRRLTFVLDETTIKLSRKNIHLQEFHSSTYLSAGLEKHIAYRLNTMTFVQFQGNFTERSMKGITYPLKLTTDHAPVFNHGNQFLTKASVPFNFRENIVQCITCELNVYQYDQISAKLKHYQNKVPRFLFVIEKQVQMKELHQLFANYSTIYLFQIERAMVMDKCIATLVYISRSAQFLKIDKQSMVNFYVSQLLKRGTVIQKFDFSQLLARLLASNLYVEVASVLGELLTRQKVDYFDSQFINIISQRYPTSQQIISAFVQSAEQGYKQEAEHVHDDTPLFGGVKVSFMQNLQQSEEDDTVSVKQKMSLTHSFGDRRALGQWEWQ